MARKRLGELLVEAGVIDEMQLQAALGQQRKYGRQLGRLLVEMGAVSEDAMVGVLSQQLNIPAVQLNGRQLDAEALSYLDHRFCQRQLCVPFAYTDRGRFLDVAMADPTNMETFDQIRVKTRCNVRPYLAGPVAIDAAIRVGYTGAAPVSATPNDGGQVEAWGSVSWPSNEPMLELGGGRGPSAGAVRGGAAEHSGGAGTSDIGATGAAHSAAPRPPVRELDFGDAGQRGAPQVPVQVQVNPAQAPPARRSRRGPTSALPPVAQPPATTASMGQIESLRMEVARLKALLERDEKVLRRLMGLMIDKGVCTRDELVSRLNED